MSDENKHADGGAPIGNTRGLMIVEDDLADLEKILPQWFDRLYREEMTNQERTQMRRVQKILSDIRWNYGPPSDITIIPADDGEEWKK